MDKKLLQLVIKDNVKYISYIFYTECNILKIMGEMSFQVGFPFIESQFIS
jgi:hypothetical protein